MIELSPDYRPDPTINPHQVLAEVLLITQLIVSKLGAMPTIGLSEADWARLRRHYEDETLLYVAMDFVEMLAEARSQQAQAQANALMRAEGHQVRGEPLLMKQATIRAQIAEMVLEMLPIIEHIHNQAGREE